MMFPFMIPVSKSFDISSVDNRYSGFSLNKNPYLYAIFVSSPIDPDGFGKVMVDGKEVTQIETANLVGFNLLLLPMGPFFNEFNKKYTVKVFGFKDIKGKHFPSITFSVRTKAKQKANEEYAIHDEAALCAAREGIVLLKNDGNLLPLKPNTHLNIFGVAQYTFRLSCTGASQINPRWSRNLFDALSDHSNFTFNRALSDYYRQLSATVPDAETMINAKKESDTAVILLSRQSGEMQDNRPIKGQYYLTDEEEAMIKSISEVFTKTILVLNTGYPIDMSWLKKYPINSIIYLGFPGMLGSYALMEILDGRISPSGHIPFTIPWNIQDNPVFSNCTYLTESDAMPGETGKYSRLFYAEDIYMGYRYFDTFNKDVAFPFGQGLSYCSFDITAERSNLNDGNLQFDAFVKNVGVRSGKQTVMVFVSAPDGKLEKPSHVLVDFEKTKCLSQGETQKIHFDINKKSFASYDSERKCWLLEKGIYSVYIGTSLDDLKEAGNFEILNEILFDRTVCSCPPSEHFEVLTKQKPEVRSYSSFVDTREELFEHKVELPKYRPQPLKPYNGKIIKWKQLLKDSTLLNDFVAQMNDKELCTLSICAGSQFLPWQSGAAGAIRRIKKYGIPKFETSDANSGLNIKNPNIGFPASSVIAATFNKSIAYEVGRIIGEEAREQGIDLNLAPAMNLHRSTLNGRHPEYYSEDPCLAGTMAGVQAKGLEDIGVAACYKHMFCNNSELSRKNSHSIVTERALRELYFRVFEIAFSIQKPSSVMTSYNALNGIYPAENADLLQKLLRDEWGFEGYIMTDWDTYDTVEVANMVNAGNCWITSGRNWNRTKEGDRVTELRNDVKLGLVAHSVLENNVRFIVKTMLYLKKKNNK